MHARFRLLPVLATALVPLACSHAQPTPAPAPPVAAAPGSPDLSGVWDWILSSVDEENNKRVEQEEWHLHQANGAIEGFYVRTVTVVSGDDNLFRCNGKRSFEKRLRFNVQGQRVGRNIVLREVAVDAEPSPCGNLNHGFQMYVGRPRGDALTLVWEMDAPTGGRQRGQQTLFRRPGIAALSTPPIEMRAQTPASSVDAVAGTWTWETRGLNAYGDTTIEQEEWHLEQVGATVRGFYDRLVTTISTDGDSFACNHQPQFVTLTRYDIEGSITEDAVELREVAFSAKPSACEERPERRLDVYRGQLTADGIQLTWGAGQQILRRIPQIASTPR